MTAPATDLATFLATRRERVERALGDLLVERTGPAATVHHAVRYAVLAGGKRLRPVLALAAAEACGADDGPVLRPALALELLHTYSLIHDDLPAMDDDDLRRGRPTVHREFDEATAILAGDGAQSLAFELLASEPAGDSMAVRRADAVACVARAVGMDGMVGGQMADLEAEGRRADLEGLDWIHRHKTGALFAASVELGAILAGATSAGREAMRDYGHALGLAFQIADDLLDLSGSPEELGKTPGKDVLAEKSTYPALLGVDEARAAADRQAGRAIARLREVDLSTPALEALARYAVERRH